MTLGVIVDYQVLFNIALGIIAFLGGIVANNISTNIREVSTRLSSLDLAHQKTREEYVPKTEHKSDLQDITHRFDRIDDKLDAIARDITTKT